VCTVVDMQEVAMSTGKHGDGANAKWTPQHRRVQAGQLYLCMSVATVVLLWHSCWVFPASKKHSGLAAASYAK
jgi:hypothetical protein